MIEVWAPNAGRVEIDAVGDGTEIRVDLERHRGGWWRWDGDPGEFDELDYGFRVDDGTILPDPRSAWQPRGVSRSRY